MKLSTKSEVKFLLKKYQLQPSKSLGQNFLIDKGAVKKVIRAADLKTEDTVTEIGPGLGILTQELAKKAKRVIAIEKDKRLVKFLKDALQSLANIEIIYGDILKIGGRNLLKNSYKIVGNLPFYLAAPVIRESLESTKDRSLEMTLVVQKEVGQRICAKVPDMNLLAVSVQFYAQSKVISYISKKSFWPQPKVDAAIIKLTAEKKEWKINKDLFFRIVKAGFSQPRKQLINNLSKKLGIDKIKIESWLWKNNIQPSQRAETLDVKSWVKLTKSFEINR